MKTPAVVLLLALSAPAPPCRVRPAPEVTPGEYVFAWWGSRYEVTLHKNGACVGLWGGTVYAGDWAWDAKARTLAVTERPEGSDADWDQWRVTLDSALAGRASWRGREVEFKAVPKRGAAR